jgi:UDP-glucose 4-epimerase
MSRYGDQEPPFVEEMKPKPVDPYGVAKVAAEQTLKILCETHGVNYAIAVPHNIIGIRQRSCDPYRNVASIMINRCKQGKPPIVYGDGEQTRCFSPVKDCIPSLLKMINGEADGHVVNIGPDKGEITIRELAETVCLYTGCLDAPVHMDGRPNEVRDAYCSSHKVRTLLDYKPQQTIHECLKEMVDAIEPSPFIYDFPIEIQTERTPKTWTEKLM